MNFQARVRASIPHKRGVEREIRDWAGICGALSSQRIFISTMLNGGTDAPNLLVCEEEEELVYINGRLFSFKTKMFAEFLEQSGFPFADVALEISGRGALKAPQGFDLEYRVETLLEKRELRTVLQICSRYGIGVECRFGPNESRPYSCLLVAKGLSPNVKITVNQARVRLNLAYAGLNKGRPIPVGAIQMVRIFPSHVLR